VVVTKLEKKLAKMQKAVATSHKTITELKSKKLVATEIKKEGKSETAAERAAVSKAIKKVTKDAKTKVTKVTKAFKRALKDETMIAAKESEKLKTEERLRAKQKADIKEKMAAVQKKVEDMMHQEKMLHSSRGITQDSEAAPRVRDKLTKESIAWKTIAKLKRDKEVAFKKMAEVKASDKALVHQMHRLMAVAPKKPQEKDSKKIAEMQKRMRKLKERADRASRALSHQTGEAAAQKMYATRLSTELAKTKMSAKKKVADMQAADKSLMRKAQALVEQSQLLAKGKEQTAKKTVTELESEKAVSDRKVADVVTVAHKRTIAELSALQTILQMKHKTSEVQALQTQTVAEKFKALKRAHDAEAKVMALQQQKFAVQRKASALAAADARARRDERTIAKLKQEKAAADKKAQDMVAANQKTAMQLKVQKKKQSQELSAVKRQMISDQEALENINGRLSGDAVSTKMPQHPSNKKMQTIAINLGRPKLRSEQVTSHERVTGWTAKSDELRQKKKKARAEAQKAENRMKTTVINDFGQLAHTEALPQVPMRSGSLRPSAQTETALRYEETPIRDQANSMPQRAQAQAHSRTEDPEVSATAAALIENAEEELEGALPIQLMSDNHTEESIDDHAEESQQGWLHQWLGSWRRPKRTTNTEMHKAEQIAGDAIIEEDSSSPF